MNSISADSWHARLFFWTQLSWLHFTTSYSYLYSRKEYIEQFSKTDLCTYVRTLLVKLPILVIAHLYPLGLALYLIGSFFFNLTLSGVATTIVVLLSFTACIALFIAISLGTMSLWEVIKSWKNEKTKELLSNTSSTAYIAAKWLSDKHNKICTLITIKKDA